METPSINDDIDKDTGLKSQKRLLVVVSLILLAISLSGAQIVEANTFILKINFTNQEYLGHVLLLSVIFLMIRYYSYARPYHKKLNDLWIKRFLHNKFMYEYCEYSFDVTGIIKDIMPSEIANAVKNEQSYLSHFLFRRSLYFWWDDEMMPREISITLFDKLSIKQYLKMIALEIKYQVHGFFSYRENLDIISPYLIGFLATYSFIFPNEIRSLISLI